MTPPCPRHWQWPHAGLAEVQVLLRALLPLPVWDVAAALAWVAYQQRRKTAAYRAHRPGVFRHSWPSAPDFSLYY